MHPHGYLEKAAEACRERGVWVVLDEVMTGFGRTGAMFAYQHEKVTPDVVALAKGLTGGYLPVAATLASREIFDAFLGDYGELKTFFHGHSYTGNALGCAAALANLKIFETEKTLQKNFELEQALTKTVAKFWNHPNVGDVRQEGLICAIEIVRDFKSRQPFPFAERIGHRICEAAHAHGLLTRPVGDVLILMPPYCVTKNQIGQWRRSGSASMKSCLSQVRSIPDLLHDRKVERTRGSEQPLSNNRKKLSLPENSCCLLSRHKAESGKAHAKEH